MSNNKKEEIFRLVKEYYYEVHNNEEKFKEGDRISYAQRVFDEQEMINLVDAALDFWLTSGHYTDEFEKGLAQFLGVKYASYVNSGSSANLLAFMALTSPLLGERRIKRGDEVITVSCGFPTTVSPMVIYGAVPVFVDVTIPEYNIDVNMLEKALSKKTKAVMIAHTLGNTFDIEAVKDFCDRHNLWLVEDNCDALGSEYLYKGKWCKSGSVGDIATSSFYPPHHMTTGEGGAVYTSSSLLNKIIKSMRDWGRDCVCPSGQDNICGHRFDREYKRLPKGYDHKYVYSHFGYNLKATDLQAAIGVAQLKKIDLFTKRRRENFDLLYNELKDVKGLILPKATKGSKPSWFGFLITCKDNRSRDYIVGELEKNNVQTRMLFAGDLLMHPCFDEMYENNEGFRVVGNLENTLYIMNNTFWVGLYPKMSEEKIKFMAKIIREAVNNINI